ncbi:uncharacterized protein [Parasteatoda tepidariorum]|uniref:uncharacterized protein n=1 Tax=Parasteatoda tepidariorum TaxID=114398 RepID=UPI0039BD20DB
MEMSFSTNSMIWRILRRHAELSDLFGHAGLSHSKLSKMSQSFKWSTGMERTFIKLFKKEPNIWNTKLPEHKDRVRRNASFEKISEKLKMKWPQHATEFTTKKLQYKFDKLKSTFQRIIRYDRKQNWVHFQSLRFLEDVGKGETSISNLEESDEESSLSSQNVEEIVVETLVRTGSTSKKSGAASTRTKGGAGSTSKKCGTTKIKRKRKTPESNSVKSSAKSSTYNLRQGYAFKHRRGNARGTPEEAANYGKKDGTFKEYRCFSPTVTRYKKSIGGSSVEQLKESCGVWLCGPPRCGKDYAVRQIKSLFIKSLNKWWDGYQNEEAVLLSDVGPSHTRLGFFLKIWTDIYPFKAETKCSSIEIRPRKVFCTSNFRLEEVFKGNILSALQARMNEYDFYHEPHKKTERLNVGAPELVLSVLVENGEIHEI